jgi:ParB-like chromosome segregation protein Spo0J
MSDILRPIRNVQIVDRSWLKPNDYNPNKVLEQNLRLLEQSILTNGWTLPIVARPDGTIIDGFHRWTVAGRSPLKEKLEGKVPVVIVDHKDEHANMYGTITHNRARGTHLLEPMERIVQSLLKDGITPKEVAKQLGMREEEVWRLSGLKREDFLEIMTSGKEYSKERVFKAL